MTAARHGSAEADSRPARRLPLRAAACAAALALAGCTTLSRPTAPPFASAPAMPDKAHQYMGSGEVAALSRQAWQALARTVVAEAKARPRDSVVLAAGADPASPRFVPCGDKPLAIVLDMDETSILNAGANYDSARRNDPPFDPSRWEAWEQGGAAYVQPVPGAVEALAAVRAAGVTPIFISNRQSRNAAGAIAALQAAGLGSAVHGETLILQGDIAPGSGKDPRRAAIAAKWCVLAMGGDQLGDFSDRFNASGLSVPARRALAQAPAIRGLWGDGWFLMPNPLYGTGLAGSLDDLYPGATRWPGPTEAH